MIRHLQAEEGQEQPRTGEGLFTQVFTDDEKPGVGPVTVLRYDGPGLTLLTVGQRVFSLAPGQEVSIPDRFVADITVARPGEFSKVRNGAAVVDSRF
jgi:hypothetical protein